MATLQAHGGATKTAVAVKPSPYGGQTRTTYALCADGAVLRKIDAQDGRDGPGWRSIQPYKIAAKKADGPAFFAKVLASPAFAPAAPAPPTANARFVMAKNGFNPAPDAPEEPPLEKLQASYAQHAPLSHGFKSDRAPPVPPGPWRSDWADGPGRLQAMNGGSMHAGLGNATFPRGLEPGMFYPSATYLTGRQAPGPSSRRWGAPATHTQIYPAALKFFEDPDGMRACWLYDAGNGRWEAAFAPRCPEMDPVMHAQDPGARLKALLIRATGCNPENAEGGEPDGLQFGAQVTGLSPAVAAMEA